MTEQATLDPPRPPVEPRLWQRRMAVLRDRGRRRLRWVVAGAVAAGLAVVLLVVLHSPVLALRHVSVVGARHTTTAAVVRAAGLDGSPPLVDIDSGAAAAHVARLPWVAHASVVRNWPDGVTITVTERVPLAVVVRPRGGVAVVDGTGHVLEWAPVASPGLLSFGAVTVPGRPGSVLGAQARPALEVADALPATLGGRVVRVAVTPGGRVWLDLGRGVSAALGLPGDLVAKLDALTSVLAAAPPTRAAVIDVTVPDEPTVGPPAPGAPPWR